MNTKKWNSKPKLVASDIKIKDESCLAVKKNKCVAKPMMHVSVGKRLSKKKKFIFKRV